MNCWDVSQVANMSGLFYDVILFYASDFHQPWGVSNVVYMTRMLEGASSFDQPICYMEVERVKCQRHGIHISKCIFNQDLCPWYDKSGNIISVVPVHELVG